MSVTRPALSCASCAPGTSRSTRAAAACSRAALRCARRLVLRVFDAQPPLRRQNSATAPFSATIASTGHVARERLAPAHRPTGHRDHRQPAAAQRCRARRARPASSRAVGRSACRRCRSGCRAPPGQRRDGRLVSGAGRQRSSRQVLHKAPLANGPSRLATIRASFEERCKAAPGPRLETPHCNRAHPHAARG